MSHKKKIAFSSNHCGAKTGFGGFMREILSYLYKTGKYELSLLAAGTPWTSEEYERWPWKIYGTMPNSKAEMEALDANPGFKRFVMYGGQAIDRFIDTVRPDVFFACEDPWAYNTWATKRWWGKIPTVVHCTLDSLPILKMGRELAASTPYFYSWADFATDALQKLGYKNAKTLRGCVNTRVFRKLSELARRELRIRHKIPEDAYCIGMLSRNQLRKSFPQLLEGFRDFKHQNPEVKNPRLLLFTHYGEGWNIPDLISEYNLDNNEILCVYRCRATGEYYIKPFAGQDIDNEVLGIKGSMTTVNVANGVTEEQINEWYNILDVYVHAFTSGGQERSIQEAKLCELITLVTNYSCGEDMCVPEAASLALDWENYRTPEEGFIKATTKPYSIAKNLTKVLKMPRDKKREMGARARKWTLENFSIEVIGKQLEELFDSIPAHSYDFDNAPKPELPNPEAPVPQIEDDATWVTELYRQILRREPDEDGHKNWMAQLKAGRPRDAIVAFFRKVAVETCDKEKVTTIQDLLGPEKPEDRMLLTLPESLGDCIYATCLLENVKSLYPDKQIYFATKPQFMDVFRPFVGTLLAGVLPWHKHFDNVYALEGYGGNEKIFEIVLTLHYPTQRQVNYIHNGVDKTQFELRQ